MTLDVYGDYTAVRQNFHLKFVNFRYPGNIKAELRVHCRFINCDK